MNRNPIINQPIPIRTGTRTRRFSPSAAFVTCICQLIHPIQKSPTAADLNPHFNQSKNQRRNYKIHEKLNNIFWCNRQRKIYFTCFSTAPVEIFRRWKKVEILVNCRCRIHPISETESSRLPFSTKTTAFLSIFQETTPFCVGRWIQNLILSKSIIGNPNYIIL